MKISLKKSGSSSRSLSVSARPDASSSAQCASFSRLASTHAGKMNAASFGRKASARNNGFASDGKDKVLRTE